MDAKTTALNTALGQGAQTTRRTGGACSGGSRSRTRPARRSRSRRDGNEAARGTAPGHGAQHGAQHDASAAAEELMFREALKQSLIWGKAEEEQEAREEGLIPDFLRYET